MRFIPCNSQKDFHRVRPHVLILLLQSRREAFEASMYRKNSVEVRLVVEHEHQAERGPRGVGQSVARGFYYTRVGLPIFRFREEEDAPCLVLAVAFVACSSHGLERRRTPQFRERRPERVVVRRVGHELVEAGLVPFFYDRCSITLLLGGHGVRSSRLPTVVLAALEGCPARPIYACALSEARMTAPGFALCKF